MNNELRGGIYSPACGSQSDLLLSDNFYAKRISLGSGNKAYLAEFVKVTVENIMNGENSSNLLGYESARQMVVQRSQCEDPSQYRCDLICSREEIGTEENYYLVPTLVLGGCAFMGICTWVVASATIFKKASLEMEHASFSDAELEDMEKRGPGQK